MAQKADKEILKALRGKRAAFIEKAKKNVKQNNAVIRKIKEQISGTGCTVPEIAQKAKVPADQVLYYIATLKKYGLVNEVAQDGDYFTYQLAEQA